VLADLTGPVIFVANHSSHLDTPTILRAIPRAWRTRTAVAAAADYFYKSRWKASAVALVFNTVPLGRSGGGLDATQHVDRLIDQRWNLLLFPEGTRSRDGSVGTVRSGAAVIAARHGLRIVPIHVSGTHAAMPPGQNWPRRLPGRLVSRRHKVEVCFGDAITVRSADERREAMDEVRAFWEREERLAASGDAAPEAHDVLLMHRALREYEMRAGPEGARRFKREMLAGDDVEEPAGSLVAPLD
jgi:1-acyl-sn-glycerol-3-phosphate acyltransferase